MSRVFLLALVAAHLLSSGCGALKKSVNPDVLTQQLIGWMTGDFSSLDNSRRDSNYYDIRLHIRPIWADDRKNHWLYVEQAMAAAEDQPYRQRVYRIERKGAEFRSVVYTLPDPQRWVGGYKTPEMFNGLNPDALVYREGCTVFLKKERDGSFRGSTRGRNCASSIRGARYVVSSVQLTENRMLTWDRGFNEKDEQVWGAVKGAYEFVKQ